MEAADEKSEERWLNNWDYLSMTERLLSWQPRTVILTSAFLRTVKRKMPAV